MISLFEDGADDIEGDIGGGFIFKDLGNFQLMGTKSEYI